jgi:hypothetical protein
MDYMFESQFISITKKKVVTKGVIIKGGLLYRGRPAGQGLPYFQCRASRVVVSWLMLKN